MKMSLFIYIAFLFCYKNVNGQVALSFDALSSHKYDIDKQMIVLKVTNLSKDSLFINSNQIDKISGFFGLDTSKLVSFPDVAILEIQNARFILKLHDHLLSRNTVEYRYLEEMALYEKHYTMQNQKRKIIVNDGAYYAIGPNCTVPLYSILHNNAYLYTPVGKLSIKEVDSIDINIWMNIGVYEKSKRKLSRQIVKIPVPKKFKKHLLAKLE